MASTISAGTTSGTALNMAGDTSGNLAFQTQAGANTITVPNVTGTILTTASTGTILQVVNASYNTQVSTSSTTWVTTGLTATITPKFATSKILIICNTAARNSNASYAGYFGIFRGSASGTNLGSATQGMAQYYSGGDLRTAVTFNYVDSPATTSATTYLMAMQSDFSSNTVYAQLNSATASITLMEIAG